MRNPISDYEDFGLEGLELVSWSILEQNMEMM